MGTDANSPYRTLGHGVGLGNVGSYQVSGMPWVTGTSDLDSAKIHMVEFPYVSQKVTVMNTSAENKVILIMFQSGSTTTEITFPGPSGAQSFAATADVYAKFHYIPLSQNGSISMEAKCTKIYIANLTAATEWGGSATNNLGYTVTAELTNIPARQMYELTGSGITE